MRLRHSIILALALCMLTGRTGRAQPPAAPPQDPLIALMAAQPPVDVWSPVVPTASFDPPAIRPGEESTYRVAFNAIEASVQWPEKFAGPPRLEFHPSARGQIVYPAGTNLQPRTAINYRVRAPETGSFVVPAFPVTVNGQSVTVPEARLEVTANAAPSRPRLVLDFADTNVFSGQRVTARVLQLPTSGNQIEAMSQVHLTGNGLLVDETAAHQSVTTVTWQGRATTAYVYETTMVPLAIGTLSVSAQGFTAANQFNGPIVIQGQVTIPGGAPQHVLLDSDPVKIHVSALPPEGELPGFTGTIGTLRCEAPQIATNTLSVGEPVKLSITVHGENGLARLVAPPPPRVRDWQVFEATAGDAESAPAGQSGEVRTFTYTLIPLAATVRATPAIPFSCFDPQRSNYVDLTIPPVTVHLAAGAAGTGELLPRFAGDDSESEKPLTLSNLAKSPGRKVASLVPLQGRAWFLFVQFMPVAAFAGLSIWDRRRRYLEQHPEIVRRRRARRALRRERRALQRAAESGDAQAFALSAANALRIACAPETAAEPRALVCADVLPWLKDQPSEKGADIVRRLFATADASRFGPVPATATSVLSLRPELDQIIEQLEDRL